VLATIAGLLLVWGGLHVARHGLDLVERTRPADAPPAPAETTVTVPSDAEHGNDLERRAAGY
jgi:hypothetical protein